MKLSNTNQRRVIVDELKKLETHPTADELYDIVRKRLPKISLGTVYRNLELLSERGDILKLHISGVQKRFDGRIDRHFHMRCLDCGSVQDLDVDELKDIEKRLDSVIDTHGIEDFSLEFQGKCKTCNVTC